MLKFVIEYSQKSVKKQMRFHPSIAQTLALTGFVAFSGAISCDRAQAVLITSPASITAPTVLNFTSFPNVDTFGAGPTQVGTPVGKDIVFTSTNPTAAIGNGNGSSYGFADNGFWTTLSYVSTNGASDSFTLTFNSAPVSAVGGLLNYAPGFGPNVLIEALGSGGTILESYDLNVVAPINTGGANNTGGFRGIQRPSADIQALRLSNSYVALNDLTFSPSAVAVPWEFDVLPVAGSTVMFGVAMWGRRKLAQNKSGKKDLES